MLDPMLLGAERLHITDAAAAIIRVENAGYLLQLRDSRPDIWYPGRWSLFGGGIEPGEEPLDALHRELREELELEFETAEFFVRIDFDTAGAGLPRFYRSFYAFPTSGGPGPGWSSMRAPASGCS